MNKLLDELRFNADGLIPVVTVESGSGSLLMQAWANREAVAATIEKGIAVYYSRSRETLWRKGESSGHTQEIMAIYLDCDSDCLCYEVRQIGGIACHTGRHSCFYRRLEDGEWQDVLPILKPSQEIYAGTK